MSNKLYDLARMTVTGTPGTGTITLNAAAVLNGVTYLTFAQAGVADGDVVTYAIADLTSGGCEIGKGTYTAAGTTLSRTTVYRSSGAGNTGKITASSGSHVFISPAAEDFTSLVTSLAGNTGAFTLGFGLTNSTNVLTSATSNPFLGYGLPINLQLNASVASNILTIAVKGNNGSDPSATNPVLLPFRDSTLTSGDPVWIAVTAALSVDTNATGATLGSVSTVPFRIWVVALNDGGTVKLALWQSVTGGASPTALASLTPSILQSTTAMSASATAAGTFYSQNGVAAVSSKAFCILGFVDYASGLTTAGTYASAPTTVQLFGPGIKRPGDTVQIVYVTNSTASSTSSNVFQSSNLTTTITPSSSPNLVRADWSGNLRTDAGATADALAQIFRGSTAIGPISLVDAAVAGSATGTVGGPCIDAPGSTSSTTYTVKYKNDDNSTTVRFCATSVPTGTILLTEIMA